MPKQAGLPPIGMYDLCLDEAVVTQPQGQLAEVIEETRRSGEPTWVTRDGQRVAVILAADVFDRLVDLAEDAMDRRELEEVQTDGDYLPWSEVKAELGLG